MPNSLLARRILRVLLGLFLGSIVVLGYTAYMWWTVGQQRPAPFSEPVLAAPTFDLVDQNGRRFTNADLDGKVWVADFIFTNCPTFCPVLTANLLRVQQRLQAEGLLGHHVMLVSFSVDPIADTPPVLRKYADRYGANHDAWRFLTGPYQYLDEVLVNGFFVPVNHIHHDDDSARHHDAHDSHHHVHDAHHDVPPPYTIMHSNRFVVVDRYGGVQAYYDGEQLDIDALMDDIRKLVQDR